MKYFIFLLIIIFIIVKCENPIQAVRSITVSQPETICETKPSEIFTEIAVSPNGGQIALIVKQSPAKADSGQTANKIHSLPDTFGPMVQESTFNDENGKSHLPARVFQNSTSSLAVNTGSSQFQINNLVFLRTDNSKVLYQLKFDKDHITNLAWNSDGQKLLFLKNSQIHLLNTNNGTINTVNLPVPKYLPLVRWGPTENELSFLVPAGNKVHQGFYNIKTHVSKILNFDLPQGIKDFSWAIKAQKVAYTVPGAAKIFIYQYKKNKLIPDTRLNIKANLFCWMRGSTRLNEKIGEYAILRGSTSLGLFYPELNQVNWLQELPSENIIDVDWAPDGKNIFYIEKEDETTFKIIREQIIYPDE